MKNGIIFEHENQKGNINLCTKIIKSFLVLINTLSWTTFITRYIKHNKDTQYTLEIGSPINSVIITK